MPVGAEPEARRFYAVILGMTEVPKPANLAGRGGVWFRTEGVAVHLGADPEFRPAKKAHPALVWSDYEAFLERLRQNGDAVKSDGHLEDGRSHCYVEDPFGNRIEIIEE